MDSTAARRTALLVASGYLFAQFYERFFSLRMAGSLTPATSHAIGLLAAIWFLAAVTAYLSMLFQDKRRTALSLEVISGSILLLSGAWWIFYMLQGLGANSV